jgi:hypothetical protein
MHQKLHQESYRTHHQRNRATSKQAMEGQTSITRRSAVGLNQGKLPQTTQSFKSDSVTDNPAHQIQV